MEKFDIVIVGAGPAGLKAAEILAKKRKKVLVLEKNKKIGPKVCAGGITDKCLKYVSDSLIRKKFNYITLVNKKVSKVGYNLYMIEREELGQFMLEKAEKSGAKVKTNSLVKEIRKNAVVVGNEEYLFDYLIGADGSNSVVRKSLGIRCENIALTIQYKVKKVKILSICFDPKRYGPWYVWVFPHQDYSYVGIGATTKTRNIRFLRRHLDHFLKRHNLNPEKLETAPINVDFKGFRFDNIFLAGDAAGLANPLTGEGIYQAIVSGEEIAKGILSKKYNYKGLKKIIDKNRRLSKIITIFGRFPLFTRVCYNLGFKFLKNKYLRKFLLKRIV